MLVLPILNKNEDQEKCRVLNFQIRLKNTHKIKTNVHYPSANESDIIVNRNRFKDSSFYASKSDKAPTDFIRYGLLNYPRSFLVTTKERSNSNRYDVYEVQQPPKKVNDELECLYGKAITDLRKEIPEAMAKGRYISLDKLGIGKDLTDEKIAKLQKIIAEERDSSRWPELFQKEGIADLQETVQFLDSFEFVLLSDHSIPITSLKDIMKALEVMNSSEYRKIKNYYEMAKSNRNIYTKISYVNKMIYDRPLTLITKQQEDQKQLIKKMDERDYKQAA